jgi:uncharacterized paraquat-inducible protein A
VEVLGQEDKINEQTIKCPICGQPYTFYPFKAGDQSACPDCIWKAKGKDWGKKDGENRIKQ